MSPVRVLLGGCLAALLLIIAGMVTLVVTSSKANAQDVPRVAIKHRANLTRAAHAAWGLDAPVAAIAAQIHQESGWNPEAVSRVGAVGMAQFMPATARWWCEANGLDAAECQPSNPTWAMRALVGYDRWLWDRIQADSACDRMAMSLSAYNGGLGWLLKDKALAQASGSNRNRWWGQVERYNAGRSQAAFAENRGYPARIINALQPAYVTWGLGVCHVV